MAELIGACMFGQSGGPTAVINASAAGVFEEAMKHRCITQIYGLAYGIEGVLKEELYDIRKENPSMIELLKTTPSSALGSVRYKLKDAREDETDYKRILEVFQKYHVRYFFYNGGNDSMDTCNKISRYLEQVHYDCRVIGIPKTIDNDICGTDHCPGFGSAAKYIATSAMELYQDTKVYNKGRITIIELMGRNAGWLTASTALASDRGSGPELIYLPEVEFDINKFIKDVCSLYEKNRNVIVAVSEGIKNKKGRYIAEYDSHLKKNKDSFGHAKLGGVAYVLVKALEQETDAQVRGVEFGLLQRCAAHCASKTDVEEAYLAGQIAVRIAVDGKSGCMIAFERENGVEYKCNIKLVDLKVVANEERKVPREWINKEGNGINKKFIEYAMPLIQGESYPPAENGLPKFSKLKRGSFI